MNKRLSVIIPGYNTPAIWWRRCLNSVLAAIGPDDEVLCVDDASPKHPDVLDEYAQKDARIVPVFLDKNGGQGRARNLAVEKAKGEWIAYVDSDDEVSPLCYAKCFDSLRKNDADVVVFGVKTIWPDDGLQKSDVADDEHLGVIGPVGIQKMAKQCLLFYPWNKIYRKSFLAEHKIFFDIKGMPCEDQMYNLECAIKGARWNTISEIGYVYYRGGNTSLGAYKKYFEDGVRNNSKMWTDYWKTLSGKDADLVKSCGGMNTEAQILWASWGNLWRNHSPYTLAGKYRWLKGRKDILGLKHPLVFFIKYSIFKFFRKYAYIRPVRRWHTRRNFPKAEDVK